MQNSQIMAEQAAEQNKRFSERKKNDTGSMNEASKFAISSNPQVTNSITDSKNVGNLVKLKQLYEKYENFVDKKMLEKILKEKK